MERSGTELSALFGAAAAFFALGAATLSLLWFHRGGMIAYPAAATTLAAFTAESEAFPAMPLPVLSLLETRVLGVLIEKQHTVPDTYPLTLVALTAGCNQKSSRDPVLDVAEAEVQATVDALKRLSLVIETSGGRVMRYAHNFGRVLDVSPQATALLTVLMLRGPQTVGDLRINTERLHRFADISSVGAFLRELAERPAGALVVELPRQPGSREPRWAHLLSGTPALVKTPIASTSQPASETVTLTEIAALRANVAQLTTELAQVKAIVTRVCKELGIAEM